MSGSLRSEALRLVTGDEVPMPPPTPDYEQKSPEALAFLENLKAPHFASLAFAIDEVFARIEVRRQEFPPYGIPGVPPESPTSWQGLAKTLRDVFVVAVADVEDSPRYTKAEGYLKVVNALDRGHWMTLADQLRHGAGTGIGTVLTVQRNAPSIIRHYAPGSSLEDCAAIMRHPCSLIVPRKQARLAINQMMAAQSALVGEKERHDWGEVNQVLDPKEFKLEADVGGKKSLAYASFENLKVPSGYRLNYLIPRLQEATLVSEVPTYRGEAVGCPLTLLQGRLAQLSDWGLEAVEHEKLWEEDWPPRSAPANV